MVTSKLGADFPYELITGNHESDGHDGDISTVGVGGVGHHDVQPADPEAGLFAVWPGKNIDRALETLDVTLTDSRLEARFVPAAGFTFTDAFAVELSDKS